MNVTDLYWDISSSRFSDNNMEIDVENQGMFGYLPCTKDYIHITLDNNIVDDILNNDHSCIKCMYYRNDILPVSNSLSLLDRMSASNQQITVRPLSTKDGMYYVGAGIIIDNQNQILLSVCRDRNKRMKLVVSPRVYEKKNALNKYIISKVIPEFATRRMEVSIQLYNFVPVKTGITDHMIDSIMRVRDDYEFYQVEPQSGES